jgi:hypothetical protein
VAKGDVDFMEQPRSRYVVAERLIRKLRDVSSCEIRTGTDGSIEAIHVTALPGRLPKQIARDIESILAAEENIRVDHRKISIAQYGDEASVATASGLERVSVAGVSLHQSGTAFEAEVTVAAGGLNATGQAAGSSSRGDTRRVVAQATLDAVGKLSAEDPGFTLGEIAETSFGSRRILLVSVNQTAGREERVYLGCCEVGYDSSRSVIYAVLDAVNRVLGTLPPREPVEYEIGPAPLA